VDVIVCEAFVGNVVLKTFEGVGQTLIRKIKRGMMSNMRSKIGAMLVKPALKETLKTFDLEQYGGAPMLGLKNLVVKPHGNSSAAVIKNAILQCEAFVAADIVGKIAENITDQKAGEEPAKQPKEEKQAEPAESSEPAKQEE